MIQLIKKNHKLIDIVSVSVFLFFFTILVLVTILSRFKLNEYPVIFLTFIFAAFISKYFSKSLNALLHNFFNLYK